MASVSKVSILDYFNIVFEGENGKIESNCKACGTRIQAKRSVTSNFVTHLKVIIFETLLPVISLPAQADEPFIPTAAGVNKQTHIVFPSKGLKKRIVYCGCQSITLLCPMRCHSEEAPGHV